MARRRQNSRWDLDKYDEWKSAETKEAEDARRDAERKAMGRIVRQVVKSRKLGRLMMAEADDGGKYSLEKGPSTGSLAREGLHTGVFRQMQSVRTAAVEASSRAQRYLRNALVSPS